MCVYLRRRSRFFRSNYLGLCWIKPLEINFSFAFCDSRIKSAGRLATSRVKAIMSDRVVHSVNDTTGRRIQPMQTYQSAWMSHWTPTSCKATADALSIASNASGNGELKYSIKDDNLRLGLDLLRSEEVTESRTSETMDDSSRMATKRLGIGGSIFKHVEKTDAMQEQRPVLDSNFERGKAVDTKRGARFPSMSNGIPYTCDTSSERCIPLDEGTSKNPLKWVKDNSPADDNRFAVLTPLQETFVGSSSFNVPYKGDLGKYDLNKGKPEVSSLIRADTVSKNQYQRSNLRMLDHKSWNKHTEAADLVCREKRHNQTQPENSMNKCFRESNTSLLFDVPSTSDNHLATFSQEWFQKMQKSSGLRPYPDDYIVSEKTEANKSYYNGYSLQKLPFSLHNVETMRICTTVEGGNLEGFPRFSQTSQSLLITKTTDFNLSKFDVFDATRVITEVKGNIAGRGKPGAVLQSLSGFTESERKGNVGDVKTCKATRSNKPSADTDTDTMDMYYFKKNPCSGTNSTPTPYKAFDMNSNLSPPAADDVSARETERRGPNNKLPDINLELPPLPAAAGSSENSGPNSSKTQSLDMDVLMAHAELSKPNSNLSLEDSREADQGNRWVKRLKLSSSQSSSQGTKSSTFAENSNDKKMKEYFTRILTNDITSSGPSSSKHHGKESLVLDNKGTLSKQNIEITTVDPTHNNQKLLSHPWIERWLHHGSCSIQKNRDTTAIREPHSSKLAMEDLQKKQFPSIGAMALMGKALRGFQPCDLRKRGSFTVWNTKTI